MLVALGDLIDDVVVRPGGPIRHATDTSSVIVRRRGGSAANVAVAAVGAGSPSRFVGQVGADPVGDVLIGDLRTAGVDVDFVRRHGTSGSIVVIVAVDGERTMLTDRRTCIGLDDPRPEWLDGATVLHVPLYSFDSEPISSTATATALAAHERGIDVSVDLSSTSVIDAMGPAAVRTLLDDLRPTVVFANEDEASALDVTGPVADAVTVVKRGAAPTTLHRVGVAPVEVPVPPLDDVGDTTGAGDAFAAGFLTCAGGWRADPVAACVAGHEAARRLLLDR